MEDSSRGSARFIGGTDHRGWGLFIDAYINDEAGLNPLEYRVYGQIARFATEAGLYQSIETIASVCLMSESSVRRSLKSLCDRGLAIAYPEPGATTLYGLARTSNRGVSQTPRKPNRGVSQTPKEERDTVSSSDSSKEESSSEPISTRSASGPGISGTGIGVTDEVEEPPSSEEIPIRAETHYGRTERVLTATGAAVGWLPPTPLDVKRHLKKDCALQVLIGELGEEKPVELFRYAFENWNRKPTWESVFHNRNQLLGAMNGSGRKKAFEEGTVFSTLEDAARWNQ